MLFIDYLARQKNPVSLSHAIADLKLPRRYMAQIGAKLVGAGLLKSREGVKGGYRLSRPLDKIKLYDVLKLFEGELKLVKCADKSYQCQWEKLCGHHGYWKGTLTDKLFDFVNKTTVADLFEKKYANA